MLELTKVTRGKDAEKAHICLPCYSCDPNPVACIPDIPCGPGLCLPELISCLPDSYQCSPYGIFYPCGPDF